MNDQPERAYSTPGETLCQRELKQENVAGVPHFVTGQHFAQIVGDDTCLYAVLTFVNVLGSAVLVLCRRKPDREWETYELMREAGCAVAWEPKAIPDDFVLSPDMLTALKNAEDRYIGELEFAERE